MPRFSSPFKRSRHPSPPPSTSSLPFSSTSSSHAPSSTSTRPILALSLTLGLILLLSLLSHPDPAARKLQFPGFLPSGPPPQPHTDDPILGTLLNLTSDALERTCPGVGAPVHLSPGLTPAQVKRYAGLTGKGKGRYMLVTNTRQIEAHLPDLLNAILVLTRYLTPQHVSISILEGPSSDCTPKVLREVLVPMLAGLGLEPEWIRVETGEGKIDWSQHNRIEKIASLRNRALAPLWEGIGESMPWGLHTEAVVFFNDVYLHAADILEVVYQHGRNGAGITTAMDWWKKRPEYYYDIWVGRTIDKGDLFYPINWPWWSPSFHLFEESPPTLASYKNLQPFQVFSSWNALAVLSPKPFMEPHNVRFRRGDEGKGECAASECTLVASDFWKLGWGRVAVVPGVQLAYERDVAQHIIEDLEAQKQELGWVDGVPPEELDTKIDWITKPPETVRCHPWPEVNGLSANVWEETRWVKPWLD
ncbi:hypothetical protein IAT38_001071 [Cryptococcus sp. DSM 104549]